MSLHFTYCCMNRAQCAPDDILAEHKYVNQFGVRTGWFVVWTPPNDTPPEVCLVGRMVTGNEERLTTEVDSHVNLRVCH